MSGLCQSPILCQGTKEWNIFGLTDSEMKLDSLLNENIVIISLRLLCTVYPS